MDLWCFVKAPNIQFFVTRMVAKLPSRVTRSWNRYTVRGMAQDAEVAWEEFQKDVS